MIRNEGSAILWTFGEHLVVRDDLVLGFLLFRRGRKTKSYTSTTHYKQKAHKYWLQRFIFAAESS
jgi:hypothetical protein